MLKEAGNVRGLNMHINRNNRNSCSVTRGACIVSLVGKLYVCMYKIALANTEQHGIQPSPPRPYLSMKRYVHELQVQNFLPILNVHDLPLGYPIT